MAELPAASPEEQVEFAGRFPPFAPWGLTPTLVLPPPHKESCQSADEALMPPLLPAVLPHVPGGGGSHGAGGGRRCPSRSGEGISWADEPEIDPDVSPFSGQTVLEVPFTGAAAEPPAMCLVPHTVYLTRLPSL